MSDAERPCDICQRPIWGGGHALNDRECSQRGGESCQLRARIAELEGELRKWAESSAGAVVGVSSELRDAKARIAELTRQHEADLSRASEITRGALADLHAARSRIAELERELYATERALKDAVAANEELRTEQKCHGSELDDVRQERNSARAEADDAHAEAGEWEEQFDAARAGLEEAVGLLLEDMRPKDDAGVADWMRRRDAFVDRLAAPAPDKEPATPPGPYSGT